MSRPVRHAGHGTREEESLRIRRTLSNKYGEEKGTGTHKQIEQHEVVQRLCVQVLRLRTPPEQYSDEIPQLCVPVCGFQ